MRHCHPRVALAALLILLLLGPLQPARAAPPMRLAEAVKPLAYQLALTVDPAQPTHTGEVDIDIELAQPQKALQLHAKGLTIRQAWIEIGAKKYPGKSRPFDAERIELRFPLPTLPAGRARLGLVFSGKQQDTDEDGLFHRREAGDWYAYTQFESTGARLVFPLFDEPGWKVPFKLTLTVPQDLVAVANTAVHHEEPAAPGFKRVEFLPTPPLPSYLLAFAVGPFDVLDAPPAGALPIRFLAPRGRAGEAAYAAGVTARIVERLEAYFDLPYPYGKLDSVALSVPAGFGAMENAGLVTYGAPLLLAAPADVTPRFQRNYVGLAAHELAHQWFGNLVTMRWWDDLWLTVAMDHRGAAGPRAGDAHRPAGLVAPHPATGADRRRPRQPVGQHHLRERPGGAVDVRGVARPRALPRRGATLHPAACLGPCQWR